MTKGISAKEQHQDRLRLRRKQRDAAASELAWGAKSPPKAIPVPTKPKRASVGLRGVKPVGRREK
jgi:hypothetical protein